MHSGLVITVVQHGADVPLDRFASWLGSASIRTIRAWEGEPVPTDPAAVGDGLIVLGGHMNALADDVAPWLPATRTLVAGTVATGVPMLGICLGAQLLAVACGGTLHVAAAGGREAGIARIRWRAGAATDPVVGALTGPLADSRSLARTGSTIEPLPAAGSTPLPSMHADAIGDLPPGAQWLGASSRYPYQAFRLGSAWGVQFHPEAGPATLRCWADSHDDVDTAAILSAYAENEPEIRAAGRAIAAGFAAVVADSVRTLVR